MVVKTAHLNLLHLFQLLRFHSPVVLLQLKVLLSLLAGRELSGRLLLLLLLLLHLLLLLLHVKLLLPLVLCPSAQE